MSSFTMLFINAFQPKSTISEMQKILVSVIVLFFQLQIFGQATYKNLVFEGAGMKGIAYVGVLEELEEQGILENIEKVAGTSSGGITAMSVALGYSVQEIKDLIYDTPFDKFNDGKGLFIGGIHRLKKRYGWFQGKNFTAWLENVIAQKTGDADITFEEWIEQGYKPLYVTGSSLSHQKSVFFSAETYPKMKVKNAVRITMSIPFYFEAVYIDEVGNLFHKPADPTQYNLVVDGGVTENFPIYLFDYLNGAGETVINHETLGIRIDSPSQVENDKLQKGLAGIPIEDHKDFVTAMYRIMLENINRQNLTPQHWNQTISISDGEISSRVRKMSVEEKETLLNNGRMAAADFLAKKAQEQLLNAQKIKAERTQE